jgi:hypothetical protein
MPSPTGRNTEGLFIQQRILSRSQLGLDASPGWDDFEVPSSEGLPKKVETKPPEVEKSSGAEAVDQENDYHANMLAEVLRERGIGEDAIRQAVDDFHRKVHDSRRARDQFPVNRVHGSEREPPTGGHFGGARRSGELPTGDLEPEVGMGVPPPQGLDSSRREIDEIHRLLTAPKRAAALSGLEAQRTASC